MRNTKSFDRYEWQKQPLIAPKKLTFEGWWYQTGEVIAKGTYKEDLAKQAWEAGQDNK